MNRKCVLIFPCGSEVGLEIYRSLKNNRFIRLIGGSSVEDHGQFVFPEYINNIPYINHPEFINIIRNIVKQYKIDAIFPTMDKVISILKSNEKKIGCLVIGSPSITNDICLSKLKIYVQLKGKIKIPKLYKSFKEVENNYPVFIKPIIGYGSRGTKLINNKIEGICHLREFPNSLIMEYLPGAEYTVDCFTDRKGELKFVGARYRNRIRMGISVHTSNVNNQNLFFELGKTINENIKFNGAWFFQVKEDKKGNLTLLEISSRLGGSSSLYRGKGINFALLSIFNAFGEDVNIIENNFNIELDRAFDNKYKMDIKFKVVYIDFDDCLIVDGKVNTDLIKLIYQFHNNSIKTILLTRHRNDIHKSLIKYRLTEVFDEIVHIKNNVRKSDYIKEDNSILIDDSFSERQEVYKNKKIPVFSLDMIETLIV